MTPLLAHAFGGVKDLPVPLWLFYYAGAAVLVFSFVALGVLWRRPRLGAAAPERRLPAPVQDVLLSPLLRLVLGALAVGLLVLVWLAAAIGTPDASVNLAPTFVFILFWIGLVPLVVVLGNVWRVLSPWKAAADGVHWLWTRTAGPWRTPLAYPERFGRWPAVALLLAFVAFELAYSDPADPRALALAIWIYSLVTWAGMLVFGREAWLESGEAFNVYFGLLARVSPFAVRTTDEGGREVVIRPPLAALAVDEERPGTLAFVALMLGSVGFDGISRTRWWQELRLDAQADLVLESPGLAELVGTALNLAGIVAAALLVAVAYLAAVAVARLVGGVPRDLAGAFLLSLVPIALVYVVAHYFSLFVLQGQFAIPLASDPFGRGADLFGTADYRADLGLLSPNAIWYTQVVALIAGHVAGLVVAHDRAVQLFTSARTAVRTQYALLALMVVYTVGGMWILSQP